METRCVNTMFEARDNRGFQCYDGNYDSLNICGEFDDVDFTANQMCCGCGGGFSWDLGSFDDEWDASVPYCYQCMIPRDVLCTRKTVLKRAAKKVTKRVQTRVKMEIVRRRAARKVTKKEVLQTEAVVPRKMMRKVVAMKAQMIPSKRV